MGDDGRFVSGITTTEHLLKHDTLLYHMGFEPILVKLTFPAVAKKLICIEEVYVSDKDQESHYRKSHALNKGIQDIPQQSLLLELMNYNKQARNLLEILWQT